MSRERDSNGTRMRSTPIASSLRPHLALNVSSLRCRRAPAEATRLDSEIRRLGDRNAIIEEQEISLGANLLAELSLRAPVAPQALPGLIVGVGIVDSHEHFQRVAIVDHPPALDDVEFIGVRRAVGVDDGLGVLA